MTTIKLGWVALHKRTTLTQDTSIPAKKDEYKILFVVDGDEKSFRAQRNVERKNYGDT